MEKRIFEISLSLTAYREGLRDFSFSKYATRWLTNGQNENIDQNQETRIQPRYSQHNLVDDSRIAKAYPESNYKFTKSAKASIMKKYNWVPKDT